MGLLDMLFGAHGASAAAQAAPQGVVPGNTWVSDQGAPQAPAGIPQDVTVTAPKPQTKNVSSAGYDNTPELAALGKVQASYPQGGGNGSGLGLSNMIPDAMPGAGTLRNILGTLGDAFLIQSGHPPIHAQQNYNRQVANASAGFENDPMGAASRIANTGAPGSFDDAQKLYTNAQTEQLKKATLDNTMEYRNSVMADRTQNHEAAQNVAQAKLDQGVQSRMAAIIAAAGNDPKKFAVARSQAASLGSKYVKGFDPDRDLPGSVDEVSAGAGMTAPQYQRNVTSNASIDERADASAARNATTRRGQDMTAGSSANRTSASTAGQLLDLRTKQNRGIPLTPAEQQTWDKGTHIAQSGGARAGLAIPGLTVGGGTGIGSNLAPPHANGTITPQAAGHPAQQFSHTATGPGGKKLGWNGKAWVDIH